MTDGSLAVSGSHRTAAPSRAARLRDSSLVLLTSADADAAALADRLHDGALQALVVARYAADAAVRGGDPAAARDAVQQALVALRREVWQLRPRGAGDLVASLQALSAQRVGAGGAPLDLSLDADVAAADLCPAGRALAYRLVQCAAGDPGPVRVALHRSRGTAVLTVTAAALDAATWGARARALGGRFDRAGAGSRTARLVLPVCDPEGTR